jgi:hypothetical protein
LNVRRLSERVGARERIAHAPVARRPRPAIGASVWGFLSKRREVLDASLTTLRAAPGGRNAINARALGRLSKCFDRPCREAVEAETCAVD